MSSLAERKRHLIVHGDEPYNAEPRSDRLSARFQTGCDDFYVRSHGELPTIDAAGYRLAVRGSVADPLDLSLDALRADFPSATVVATLQCAGNRRGDLRAVAPVSGDPWGAGAIGTAAWTGVRLADVLRAAGLTAGSEDRHVAFACHDRVHDAPHRFGVSIGLGKALAPETLLAFAMNGEPLPREHGFPLRAVVPGYAGVRSPKWLASVTVQDQPSDNPIQAADYKLFPPDLTEQTADPARGHTIELMPLNSAISEPVSGTRLPAGPVTLRGYAIAGDRAVVRVDVSGDGGRTWRQALLAPERAPFAWTLWSAEIDLPPGEHDLAVRAWDEAGQTQPSAPEDTWNFKGYLNASWHRIRVEVS